MRKIAGLFLVFVFAVCLPLGWAQTAEENSCITCHSDLWDEMKKSVHARQGITCERCHGGDPTQLDFELAKAPGTNFRGVPDKKQIAETCGGCHADVETMNFYGVRTDQLARYKTSQHGKKLFLEGDNQTAVCSDCHGSHNVLPISDPQSTVYPLNLPKTCNHCHGDKKIMEPYGHPTDIFETYRQSVHGKALFEKNDLSVANCASCHGSHGAVPPGVKEISATCGKCHINEKKFFLESVHAQAAQQGKFSECISCHGYHGVQHADRTLYQKTCVQCHAQGSRAAEEGLKISQVLERSERELKNAETLVKKAAIEGIFVDEEQGALEEAKTNVIAMAPLQHSLSSSKISELHQKFTGTANEIQTQVLKKRRALTWRKILLIPIWILVVTMMATLWMKYRQLKFSKKKPGDQNP